MNAPHDLKIGAWRKIEKEDIKRGTIIRMTKMMNDGAYHMATIICTREAEGTHPYPHVMVSRPYAYANLDYDSKSPLLGTEVFAYGINKMLGADSDVEVFQGRDEIRSMAK